MLEQLARDQRHVQRARIVAVRVQPGGVDVVGVLHPELRGALVHRQNEAVLAAVDVLGQRDRRVVGRHDDQTFEQLGYAHLLARLQIDLRAAHRRGARADRHLLVHRNAPAVDGLHNQQRDHHLRDRGNRHGLVLVLLKEDAAALRFHQQRAAHGEVADERRRYFVVVPVILERVFKFKDRGALGGQRRSRKSRKQQRRAEQQAYKTMRAFHPSVILSRSFLSGTKARFRP